MYAIIAEEAQSTVAGLGDSAVHQKYVELVSDMGTLSCWPDRLEMIVHRAKATRA